MSDNYFDTSDLGKLCYIKARIGWRGLSSNEYVEEGPFLVAGKHIKNGKVDWEKCDHITDFRYDESHEIALKGGDVIITKDGTIGRVARIDTLPGKTTINGTMMLIRPEKKLNYRYLYHYLNGRQFKKLIDDKVSGSSIPHIFQRDMVGLEIRYPEYEFQTLIADVLDSVDTQIRETETIITKLQQVKQGLLHDLLTRGVDENGELRPSYEDAPELYKSSELGWIPKDWDVESIQNLLSTAEPAMRSGPFGSALLKSELVEKGFPLLGIDNVFKERFSTDFKRFVTSEKFDELSRYAVRKNDLLITIMGTVGRCCLVPEGIGKALSSKHTWCISLDTKKYLPYLAMLQVNYAKWVLAHFSKGQQGGTMEAIRSDTLRNTPLPKPPIEEQEVIERVLKEASDRLTNEAKTYDKLKLKKSGLMDDLLTGKKRVTDLLMQQAN